LNHYKEVLESKFTFSEKQFKLIWDNSKDGIRLIDKNGIIVQVNNAYCEMIDKSQDELLNQEAGSVFFKDDAKRVEIALINRFRNNQIKERFEKEVRLWNNKEVWFEVTNSIVKFNDEEFLLSQYRDITEKKSNELKLRNSLTKLYTILDNFPGGVLVESENRVIEFANETFCRIFKIPAKPKDLVGLDCRNSAKDSKTLFKDEDKFISIIEELVKHKVEKNNIQLELKTGGLLELNYIPIIQDDLIYGSLWLYKDITVEKKLELELQESENKLRELINLMPDIVCFKDGNGKWIEANQYDLKLFDIENVDYRGKTDKDLAPFSPFYYDAFMNCETSDNKAWEKGEEFRCEEIIPKPDGNEIIFDIIKKPNFNEDGSRKGLLVVGRDITERKKSEELIIENKRKLDTLIGNIPGIVYRCLNDENWTMKFISSGTLNLTGFSPEDLLDNRNLSYNDLIHLEDREYVANEIQKSIKDNNAFQLEYRIIDKHKNIKWVYEKGCLVKDLGTGEEFLEGIIIDVTERIIAEKNLRKSEDRLNTFYEASFSGVIIHDNGVTVDCNKGICDMLGYKREELINTNGINYFHESEREKIQKIISHKSIQPYETIMIKKDGSLLNVRVQGKEIFYMNRVLRFTEFSDITYEKRTESLNESRLKLLDLSYHTTIDELLQAAVNEVESLTHSKLSFYNFIDNDEKDFTLTAWSSNTLKSINRNGAHNLNYNINKDVELLETLLQRKVIIHNNLNTKEQKCYFPLLNEEVKRELVVPVIRNEKVIAILGVGNKDSDYNDIDIEITANFADIASGIVERKITLDNLREKEERLRLALKAADQGLWDLNLKTGESKVSDEYLTMLDYNPNNYIETYDKWIDRMHPDDKERVEKIYKDYMDGLNDEYKIEFRQRTADGNYKWILSLGKIIQYDKENKPIRIIGTHTDISKFKETEERFVQLTEILNTITLFATEFINVPLDKIDETIINAIEKVGNLFKVDRVYLFDYLFDKGIVRNTFEWCNEGVSKEIENSQNIPIASLSGWMDSHQNNKPVLIYDVSQFDKSNELKEILTAQNIKSLITAPMFIKNKLIGFVGFDSVKSIRNWNDDEVNLLRILAELFSNLADRKESQYAIAQSEYNFRKLIDNSPDGIGVIKGLKIIIANKSAANILGYNTSNDLLNKDPFMFVHKDSKITAEKLLIALKNNQEHDAVIVKFTKPNNTTVTCEVKAVSYRIDGEKLILITFRDITEKLQREIELNEYREHLEELVAERTKAIEQQSEFFKIFINTIPNPAYVKDLNGNYTEVNEAFLKYFEVTREEIIGKTISAIAPEDVVKKSIAKESSLLMEVKSISYETYHITKEGKRRELLTYKASFAEQNKKPIGITGLVVDITNQKRLTDQIIQAYEKEKELNEIKTNFISMASHEFRTPLTTILASTELIGLHIQKGNYEKLNTHIKRVQEAVGFMNSLLEEVLILSRTDRGIISFNPTSNNLRALLTDLIEQCKVSASKDHKIVFNYFPERTNFILDARLLTLIFNNLLTNAIKYSPIGGLIHFDVYCENETLLFRITDSGMGISQKDLPLIFEPFFRASTVENIQGSGLGLSIVKTAVDLHKGNIFVKSTLNSGTEFTVKIKTDSIT
jgi:PAS domain S-box-containing protein